VPRESILVVDDHIASLKLAWSVLSNEGYEVRTAAGLDEALQVLTRFTPRLVLMNLELAGVNGLELTRRLREDAATRAMSILALISREGDRDRALAAGFGGWISKPIAPRQLPGQVAEFLGEAP